MATVRQLEDTLISFWKDVDALPLCTKAEAALNQKVQNAAKSIVVLCSNTFFKKFSAEMKKAEPDQFINLYTVINLLKNRYQIITKSGGFSRFLRKSFTKMRLLQVNQQMQCYIDQIIARAKEKEKRGEYEQEVLGEGICHGFSEAFISSSVFSFKKGRFLQASSKMEPSFQHYFILGIALLKREDVFHDFLIEAERYFHLESNESLSTILDESNITACAVRLGAFYKSRVPSYMTSKGEMILDNREKYSDLLTQFTNNYGFESIDALLASVEEAKQAELVKELGVFYIQNKLETSSEVSKKSNVYNPKVMVNLVLKKQGVIHTERVIESTDLREFAAHVNKISDKMGKFILSLYNSKTGMGHSMYLQLDPPEFCDMNVYTTSFLPEYFIYYSGLDTMLSVLEQTFPSQYPDFDIFELTRYTKA